MYVILAGITLIDRLPRKTDLQQMVVFLSGSVSGNVLQSMLRHAHGSHNGQRW